MESGPAGVHGTEGEAGPVAHGDACVLQEGPTVFLQLNSCGKMGKKGKQKSDKHGTLTCLLWSLHQTVFRAQQIRTLARPRRGPGRDTAVTTAGCLRPSQPPHGALRPPGNYPTALSKTSQREQRISDEIFSWHNYPTFFRMSSTSFRNISSTLKLSLALASQNRIPVICCAN